MALTQKHYIAICIFIICFILITFVFWRHHSKRREHLTSAVVQPSYSISGLTMTLSVGGLGEPVTVNFGDGMGQNITTPTVTHTYSKNGIYTITLTGTNGISTAIITLPTTNIGTIDLAVSPIATLLVQYPHQPHPITLLDQVLDQVLHNANMLSGAIVPESVLHPEQHQKHHYTLSK